MTDVLSPSSMGVLFVQPKQIPRQSKPKLPAAPVMIPEPPSVRSGHLSLDVFSPVNQNGSFEFDRVLKSGEVYKRTRKTKVCFAYVYERSSLIISLLAMEEVLSRSSPKPPLHVQKLVRRAIA